MPSFFIFYGWVLSVEVIAEAIKRALNGTSMLMDEVKMGEFVTDTTERVIFA
jgi:hypothetical protein